jgi:RNA polymerase sigma-70 factor (ECF subfamily)
MGAALSRMTDSAQIPPLSEIYRQHADFVWRALLRFGIEPAHAEDVAHEVFLVVRRRLPDFDGRAPLRSWIYGIARGVAANARRSRIRAERRLQVVEPPPSPVTPEQAAQHAEAARLVTEFVETLPPPQREVFVLVDIEGLRGPEVAHALGDNLNSVYSRLRLARGRFRRFVAERGIVGPAGKESA